MMRIRSHIRLVSILLAGIAGAGVLTIGFGLTPLSGSVFGPMLGLGPKPDFSLSSNSPITLTQGQTRTVSVTITSINHLSGDASVTAILATASGTPPVVSTTQSSVKLTPNGNASLSVTITTTNSTTLGNYNIKVTGMSGSLGHSLNVALTVNGSVPGEALNFKSYAVNSNTNLTLTIQNFGSINTRFVSYYVQDASLDQNNLVSWNGPIITPGQTRNVTILIGASCNGCVRVGSAFNFTTYGAYRITLVTALNNQFTFTIGQFSNGEAMALDAFSFSSSTNVTMYMRSTGTVSIQLAAYSVKDASGDYYTMTSFPGPTIAVNQVVPVAFTIGSSCSGCTLTGSPFTFNPGYSYTITITSARNTPFTYVVTR
jgi:hypothetical protein